MAKKYKILTASQVMLRCLIIGVISAIILNQLALQYYSHKYFDAAWEFYGPINSYNITKYFIGHYQTYSNGFISAAEGILYITFLGAFIISIYIALVFYRVTAKKNLYSERYGTAKFADKEDVLKSDKIDIPFSAESYKKHGRYGVFIGAIEDKSGKPITWINDDKTTKELELQNLAHFGSQHIFMFAPTGSGKGVGIVMPVLVTYPSSVFVYDLKGENHVATSGYRQKKFNNIIIKFEPSSADGTSARYNPLDEIRLGTIYEVQDAQKVALSIIDQDGKGLHDHWRKMAFDLMVGVILHILYTKKARNLQSVALLLSGIEPDTKISYENETQWLKELAGMEVGSIHASGYARLKNISEDEAQKYLFNLNLVDENGINTTIKSTAAALVSKEGKAEGERSSIITSASAPLSLYKDPVVAKNTESSDFRLDDLQNFKHPVSFYFIVPNDQRERLKPLVRLFITQLINNIQSSQDGKKRELLMLLDEFPELNKIENMESALATIRGYKVRMLLIAQDYLQLTKYYGESQTIFSNCGVRIAYAPNELKTAEMLSKYTGVTTFVAESINTTINKQPFQFTVGSGSTSISKQETSRSLMTADEIARLGDEMIILIEKTDPIKGHKFRWFHSPEYRERIYDVQSSSNPGNIYKPVVNSNRIIHKQA